MKRWWQFWRSHVDVDAFVCGPRGELRVGEGRRTFAGMSMTGWVVYRESDPRRTDPVFSSCCHALEYARMVVS